VEFNSEESPEQVFTQWSSGMISDFVMFGMMDLQIKKYNLIQWLINSDDEGLIETLESIRLSDQEGTKDWWNELSEEQCRGLENGMESLKNGNSFSHEEVRQGIKDKFGI
jgi:hypothetical protein